MTQMETYQHTGDGYNPFLIRPGWQVAQLNYSKDARIENIERLDVHYETDEVFFLIKGNAVLIGASISEDDVIDYDIQQMKPGITYNIPANMWHNIVMSEDTQVLIVEKDKTHLGDFEFYYLSDIQKSVLTAKVNSVKTQIT